MNTQKSFFANLLQSNTFRMFLIGTLALLLLIPLSFVKELVRERKSRQERVVDEIDSKWGSAIYFYGPILKIPYKVYSDTKRTTYTTSYAYFFPEELKNNSHVQTEVRKRNNYESAVFTAAMDFTGRYIAPDFSSKGVLDEDIDWDKATILIRTTNLSSIKNIVTITLGGKSYPFEPIYDQEEETSDYSWEDPNTVVEIEGESYGNYRSSRMASLQTAFIPKEELSKPLDFSLSITYDGSKHIAIAPIGKSTEGTISSNWPNPSFVGNFLPYEKQITPQGFTASWRVLYLNRPFSQQSFGELPKISSYAYQVNFVIPVDEYQQNERAAKYGFLVIGLTFLIFFLLQHISRIKIHIFQYTMIGLALVLFYTLLVSITEHSSFTLAYLLSSVMTIGLIALYSVAILKSKKFPLFIGAALAALYGFIYVIIQLENYALLVGSLGLFTILALVMYASRKIDWNQ